jgi:hypothetical protein
MDIYQVCTRGANEFSGAQWTNAPASLQAALEDARQRGIMKVIWPSIAAGSDQQGTTTWTYDMLLMTQTSNDVHQTVRPFQLVTVKEIRWDLAARGMSNRRGIISTNPVQNVPPATTEGFEMVTENVPEMASETVAEMPE